MNEHHKFYKRGHRGGGMMVCNSFTVAMCPRTSSCQRRIAALLSQKLQSAPSLLLDSLPLCKQTMYDRDHYSIN